MISGLEEGRLRSGSSHADHISGCIGIPLSMIFGYVIEYIGVHLLANVWSILVARSLGMRLGTMTQWLDRTGR
jgi:hypothetical protein